MNVKHLRKIRIALAMIVFIAMISLFLDIHTSYIDPVSTLFLRLQLFPSLIRFFALFFTVSALGFVFVLILTFLLGRVYCSTICPLGTLQDMIIRTASWFKKKKHRRFAYSDNKNNILRYGILSLTLLLWILGSMFLINLLDPYSNFGKMTVVFLQPLFIWINNGLAIAFESQGHYVISPLMVKSLPLNVAAVSGVILLTVILMSSLRGRLFCNTICPVGSMLSLIASKSLYQVAFIEESCNLCGRCEKVCKAACINSKTKEVDHGRCVSCFNCFSACKNQGLTFKHISSIATKNHPKETNSGKRKFLLTFAASALSLPMMKKLAVAQGNLKPGMVPTGTENPVTPPGSIDINHFTKNCIACYLCVGACPTNVIVPSFFDYGLEGFMQPKLDFHKNFCNFDCVRCTEVCPTGAITKQTMESKQEIQIGVARFIRKSCIVRVDRTDCGACSEHCPTKAVSMVPFGNGLSIPEVDPDLCIGCGACEYACPTTPYKAIYVESNLTHQKARRIEEGSGPREVKMDDFPF